MGDTLEERELESVARTALDSDRVKVLWFEKDSRSSNSVVGFQATHSRIRLQTDKGPINLFLKQTPHSSEKVINFYKELRGFEKESTVYERILPEISSIVSSPRLARCFLARGGGQGDPRRELLVLEDLQEYGFRNADDFDFQHFQVALRGLASFHAASMLAQRNGTLSLEVVSWETFFSGDRDHPGRRCWDSFVATSGRMMRELYPRAEEEGLISRALQVMASAPGYIGPSATSPNCLCHGDPWRNNILFRYDELGKPSEVALVDFSSARVGPPALDVLLFLYSQPFPLDFDQALSTYHTALGEALPDGPNFDSFLTSCRAYLPFALSVSCLYTYLTLLPVKYLRALLDSQESFIEFAMEGATRPAFNALRENPQYRSHLKVVYGRLLDYCSLSKPVSARV